ncbi:AAA family ATPase [Demequina salsinemoris]|uniref:AAA family ATPase n=1 Tax=Demequina salsinemoris TaxID=577470 RepID=UPI0007856EFB|nr:AAA family ATPase [Demequina salsinemoris]
MTEPRTYAPDSDGGPPRSTYGMPPRFDPTDLLARIAAGERDPGPSLVPVEDRETGTPTGAALWTPGTDNAIIGPRGSGKSWLGLFSAASVMAREGWPVFMLDVEHRPRRAYERLTLLGLDIDTILSRFDYRQMRHMPDSIELWVEAEVERSVEVYSGALVLIDSRGASMARTYAGGRLTESAPDADLWHTRYVAPLLDVGATVVLVDHTPKGDAKARDSAGSLRKDAAIQGTILRADVIEPPTRTNAGTFRYWPVKDNDGWHDEGRAVADLRLAPDDDGLDARLVAPSTSGSTAPSTPARPVRAAAVWRFIEAHPGANVTAIRKAVSGRGTAVDDARRWLVDHGHVVPDGDGFEVSGEVPEWVR